MQDNDMKKQFLRVSIRIRYDKDPELYHYFAKSRSYDRAHDARLLLMKGLNGQLLRDQLPSSVMDVEKRSSCVPGHDGTTVVNKKCMRSNDEGERLLFEDEIIL